MRPWRVVPVRRSAGIRCCGRRPRLAPVPAAGTVSSSSVVSCSSTYQPGSRSLDAQMVSATRASPSPAGRTSRRRGRLDVRPASPRVVGKSRSARPSGCTWPIRSGWSGQDGGSTSAGEVPRVQTESDIALLEHSFDILERSTACRRADGGRARGSFAGEVVEVIEAVADRAPARCVQFDARRPVEVDDAGRAGHARPPRHRAPTARTAANVSASCSASWRTTERSHPRGQSVTVEQPADRGCVPRPGSRAVPGFHVADAQSGLSREHAVRIQLNRPSRAPRRLPTRWDRLPRSVAGVRSLSAVGNPLHTWELERSIVRSALTRRAGLCDGYG